MNLPELRNELKLHLGLPEGHLNFDDTRLDLLINRSFWEITDKLPFRYERSVEEETLTAGNKEHLLLSGDPFEAIIEIGIYDSETNKRYPLSRINEHEFESIHKGSDEQYRGMPTKYLRSGDYIWLDPVPDKAYTLIIHHDITIEDYSNALPDSVLPKVWHEVILFGAVYRGYVALGDMVRAQEFRNMQINFINSATAQESKEEKANTQEARLVPVRPAYRV